MKLFFEQPILDSPYLPPTRHHALSDDGQPLDLPPVEGRRRSQLITPIPAAKKQRGRSTQQELGLGLERDEGQAYNPIPIMRFGST